MIKARVVGGKELSAKFKMLEKAVQDQALEGALTSGALLVANAAKQKAPYKTGTLRRSLHVGGHTDLTPDFEGTDIGKIKSSGRPAVAVGSNAPYAARIEFGFRGEDKLGRNYDQPAQPYLRPAFRENKQAAITEVKAAFRLIVNKALLRLAGMP